MSTSRDGTLERAIPMPVPCATSCCLGGPDLRTLYITTDGRRLCGEADDDPLPGRLLALDWDVPGLPCPRMYPLDGTAAGLSGAAAGGDDE